MHEYGDPPLGGHFISQSHKIIIITPALAIWLGLPGFLVFCYQTPAICFAALRLNGVSRAGGRLQPPGGSGLRCGNAATRGWTAASVHPITEPCLPTAKLYFKKQEPPFPFLPSDEEAIPGSPCYGVLPFISSLCLFMDSYNHFFFCQCYFKHKDFLCRCLSHQNNDRLQPDPQ